MRHGKRAALLLAGTIATLVACGGGGGTTSGPAPSGAKSIQGTATLTIPGRPAQSKARKPAFISLAVLSATLAVNGTVVATADLSPTSKLCTITNEVDRTCTIPLNAPAGNDTFVVTLFDAANGTGKILGIGNATQAISGTTFTLPITVGGVVATVILSTDGGTLVAGAPRLVPLYISARDADGVAIVGTDPFASPVTLTDSDTSGHTHLTSTVITNPNAEVSLSYDGTALAAPVTIGATGGGSTTVTPVTIPVVTATPTPTPIAVASVPSFGFGGFGYSCSGTPQFSIPGTALIFVSEGTMLADGDYVQQLGEWAPIPIMAASGSPTATPTPTVTPTPSPTPTGSPTVYAYLWYGTFTLNQPFNGQTGGCFFVINIAQVGSPTPSPSPGASPAIDSEFIGVPNVGNNVTFGSIGTVGYITTVNLSVSRTAGTGSGTFTLDNGTTGTMTIYGSETFAAAQKRLQQAAKMRALLDAARHRNR
jgi:hypothetical protein